MSSVRRIQETDNAQFGGEQHSGPGVSVRHGKEEGGGGLPSVGIPHY